MAEMPILRSVASDSPASSSGWVKDGNLQSFEKDVVLASTKVPVIVDFWAPWCGPCKQLGPALEKAVNAYAGKILMVKINLDQNPELAQMLRVQSIPTVYAFFQGQPIDGFMGALPEGEIKKFIDRVLKMAGAGDGQHPIDAALREARDLLEGGDAGMAASLLRQLLPLEPHHPQLLALLARAEIANHNLDGARAALGAVKPTDSHIHEVAAALAALEVAEQAGKAGSVVELEKAVARDGNDFQARFDLALALYAQQRAEDAIDQLLEIIRRNRGWNDEAARLQLLKFFDALGATDPITVNARRRLSSILFA